MTDVLEIKFSMPSFSLQQLTLLSKVTKVSQMVAEKIVHKDNLGYRARTSIRYDERHDRDTFVARYLGYSSEITVFMLIKHMI